MLISPKDITLCDNQFGFRSGCGVYNGLNLLNDLMCYCKHTDTNMFLCSLDVENVLILYGMMDFFISCTKFYPIYTGDFSVNGRFYSILDVVIKWNGTIDQNSYFKVTRDTRQGSILSPILFNIFTCELLVKLQNCDTGIRLGDKLYNSFAYADDISLFTSTVTGLQDLINICTEYSTRWRFNFGINKTKCMPIDKSRTVFSKEPVWYLKDVPISSMSNVDILGVNFKSNVNYDDYVQTRVQKCKRSMYSLRPRSHYTVQSVLSALKYV